LVKSSFSYINGSKRTVFTHERQLIPLRENDLSRIEFSLCLSRAWCLGKMIVLK
jgi:hypothetical protein